MSKSPRSHIWPGWASALAVIFILPGSASAGSLEGRLTDAMTGTPIPDATVRVLENNRTATTTKGGGWSFDLPEGEYTLEIKATLGSKTHRFRLVNQHVPQYKSADTQLPTIYFVDEGVPVKPTPIGAPVPHPAHPSGQGGPVDLDRLPEKPFPFGPGAYTLHQSPPLTLRVARREDKETCRNSPIVAIERIPLESYIKGVLPPEIGVFRNQSGAMEVFKAFAPAAKSYGLWFLLRHQAGQRRIVESAKPPHGFEWFHLDDTPCNQRYSDMRFEKTSRATEAMRRHLLVKQSAPDTIDKYEYAASCGGHGTRPAYQTEVVDDQSPSHSCVGDWCGHDSCAGHADHPHVTGDDRCLVRGMCQWGALEWATSGKTATWLLNHYQPNLRLRDLTEDPIHTSDPMPDSGQRADSGLSEPPDATPIPRRDTGRDASIAPVDTTRSPGRYGGLGPMVSSSSGNHQTQTGCHLPATTYARPSGQTPFGLSLVALGLVGCRRRW